MSPDLPAAIQAILDAEGESSAIKETVVHELIFSYDGISLATFESASPIQLPVVGSTVTVHYSEVTVTEVDISYTVLDGVQRVTAEVEVEPA